MAWQQQYNTSSSPLPIRRPPSGEPYVEMNTIGSVSSTRAKPGGQSPSRMEPIQAYASARLVADDMSVSSTRVKPGGQSPSRKEPIQAYASARLVVDDMGPYSVSSNGVKDSDYCTRPACYEKDSRINTLTRQLDLCHDESRNLRTMLVEKKHELGSLQQRIDQLEADNAKLKQPHDSLEKASIQHDMAHLQVLQRQVDSLQKKNQELMLEVARAREQSQDQQEVVQLRMQKEKLQQEVQYLSVQLQKKNTDPRELEMYRIECRDLKGEVEILRQQVLTYTEDFHTERSDRQRAQAALHRLEEERDNLQKTIAMLKRS